MVPSDKATPEDIDVMNPEEEKRLVSDINSGDARRREAAILRIAASYTRLIRSFIAPFLKDKKVESQELQQAAILAITQSAPRWDASQGNRLVTYLYDNIRGAIYQAVEEQLGKLPPKIRKQIKEYRRAVSELEQQASASPSEEQIAQELGWGIDKVCTIAAAANRRTYGLDVQERPHTDPAAAMLSGSSSLEETESQAVLSEQLEEVLRKCRQKTQQIYRAWLACKGDRKPYRTVAEQFQLTVSTVKDHVACVHRLLRKASVESVTRSPEATLPAAGSPSPTVSQASLGGHPDVMVSAPQLLGSADSTTQDCDSLDFDLGRACSNHRESVVPRALRLFAGIATHGLPLSLEAIDTLLSLDEPKKKKLHAKIMQFFDLSQNNPFGWINPMLRTRIVDFRFRQCQIHRIQD